MYIDNTNLVRKAPRHPYWKFNNKGRSVRVLGPSYIRLSLEEGTIRSTNVFSNKDLFFPEFFQRLYKTDGIKVIYTKLDVGQTNIQLRNNKYFKAFIEDKQIITEYE